MDPQSFCPLLTQVQLSPLKHALAMPQILHSFEPGEPMFLYRRKLMTSWRSALSKHVGLASMSRVVVTTSTGPLGTPSQLNAQSNSPIRRLSSRGSQIQILLLLTRNPTTLTMKLLNHQSLTPSYPQYQLNAKRSLSLSTLTLSPASVSASLVELSGNSGMVLVLLVQNLMQHLPFMLTSPTPCLSQHLSLKVMIRVR